MSPTIPIRAMQLHEWDRSVSLWVRNYIFYFLSSGSFRFSRFRLSNGWHGTGGTVCAAVEKLH